MDSRVTGSLSRIMRCWPVGRPSVCEACSSVKVKMRVSQETEVLVWSSALVQARALRKVGRGVDEGVGVGEGAARARRDDSERLPMWYSGIIAFAVSLSVRRLEVCGFILGRCGGSYGWP